MNYLGGFNPIYFVLMPLMTSIGAVLGAIANGWMQRRNSSGTIKTSQANELWLQKSGLEDKLMAIINQQTARIEKLERDYAKTLEDYYKLQKEKAEADIKILALQEEIKALRKQVESCPLTCPYAEKKI